MLRAKYGEKCISYRSFDCPCFSLIMHREPLESGLSRLLKKTITSLRGAFLRDATISRSLICLNPRLRSLSRVQQDCQGPCPRNDFVGLLRRSLP